MSMRSYVIGLSLSVAVVYLAGCASTPEPTPYATPEDRMAALDDSMDLPLAPLDADAAFGEPNPEDTLILQDIHFDFDRSEIRESEKPPLAEINAWLLDHPGTLLMMEGHCDERGTLEYNMALGERRGLSIRTYLTGLGTNPDRLHTISYGEEQPLCTESDEACWAQNRRGHFLVDYGQGGTGEFIVEEEIGLAPEPID